MDKRTKAALLGIIGRYLVRTFDERTDAESEEATPKKKGKEGGHGNTRIPYGLCKEFGIQTGKDWTPRDAWNALKGTSVTHPDEIWETLKEHGNTTPWKGEYRESAPRNLTDESFGSLMPKGKTKKTAAQEAMEKFIETSNKKYSARGDTFVTDLYGKIGDLEKGADSKAYIAFGTEAGDTFYYNPHKNKVKVPAYIDGRPNHYFMAGTASSLGSYLDYLCGEDGKPMSMSDKAITDVIDKYAGKELDSSSLPWTNRALNMLHEHTNKKIVNSKAKAERELLKKEMAEDYDKMIKDEITDYEYYNKEFNLINNDDRFKHIKEVDIRQEREDACRREVENLLRALSLPYHKGVTKEKMTELKANQLVSSFMSLAQTEPRAVAYLSNDMPDVWKALSDYAVKICDKADVKMKMPKTVEKFTPLPEEAA